MVSFKSIWDRCVKWQRKVFVGESSLAAAKHLREEADELIKAIEIGGAARDITINNEIADVMILLIAVADREHRDILLATDYKMNINEARKWGKPDSEGVTHHIKE